MVTSDDQETTSEVHTFNMDAVVGKAWMETATVPIGLRACALCPPLAIMYQLLLPVDHFSLPLSHSTTISLLVSSLYNQNTTTPSIMSTTHLAGEPREQDDEQGNVAASSASPKQHQNATEDAVGDGGALLPRDPTIDHTGKSSKSTATIPTKRKASEQVDSWSDKDDWPDDDEEDEQEGQATQALQALHISHGKHTLAKANGLLLTAQRRMTLTKVRQCLTHLDRLGY